MKSFNRNNTETPGIFVPINRESPKGRQHLHTMEAGAWLPFAQASMTGLIVGIVCLVLASFGRWRNPWGWGAIPGVLTWGLTWLSLQRHWFSLTKLEEVTGLDLNRDGVIGDNQGEQLPVVVPENSPRVISVQLNEVRDNGHLRAGQYFDLHATNDQMIALADGLLEQEQPFSVREWCGAGKPFSGAQFARLREEMIRNELLEQASDKDARRGYVLTKAGRAVLEDFLTNPSVRVSV